MLVHRMADSDSMYLGVLRYIVIHISMLYLCQKQTEKLKSYKKYEIFNKKIVKEVAHSKSHQTGFRVTMRTCISLLLVGLLIKPSRKTRFIIYSLSHLHTSYSSYFQSIDLRLVQRLTAW